MSGDRPEKAAAERMGKEFGWVDSQITYAAQIIRDSYAQGPAVGAEEIEQLRSDLEVLKEGAEYEHDQSLVTESARVAGYFSPSPSDEACARLPELLTATNVKWLVEKLLEAYARQAPQPQECRSCGKPLIAQAIQVGRGLCLVCLDEQPTAEGPKCDCGHKDSQHMISSPGNSKSWDRPCMFCYCTGYFFTAPTPAPAAEQEKPHYPPQIPGCTCSCHRVSNETCGDCCSWPAETLNAEERARKLSENYRIVREIMLPWGERILQDDPRFPQELAFVVLRENIFTNTVIIFTNTVIERWRRSSEAWATRAKKAEAELARLAASPSGNEARPRCPKCGSDKLGSWTTGSKYGVSQFNVHCNACQFNIRSSVLADFAQFFPAPIHEEGK